MSLVGKAALVTGGGRGIGKAIALAFAHAGVDVAVLARTVAEIEEVAEAIRQLGRQAAAVPCDIGDPDDVAAQVEAVCNHFGRMDIVVNNAGGGTERKCVGEDDPERWRRVVEVNLLGTYCVIRSALPFLRRSGGGTIINVGSGMGHQARPGNSSYHVAKAGTWMLTRCLALELWQDHIAVNELIPGPVATNLTAELFTASQPHPTIPSEWVKDPSDVVPLALFLAQQATHGPTGQSFSLARRPLA